ncbi:hypothetical protein Dimus_002036 [Dionaea muscipula]
MVMASKPGEILISDLNLKLKPWPFCSLQYPCSPCLVYTIELNLVIVEMRLDIVAFPSQMDGHVLAFNSGFLSAPAPAPAPAPASTALRLRAKPMERNAYAVQGRNKRSCLSLVVTCAAAPKIIRDPVLDRQVTKQNRIRFVQKLRTLLLSKPKHFIPLSILSKCRSYLSLPKPRSILSMIHRYPTIFEVFTIPFPNTPMNATKLHSQLCVRLTPAAELHAAQEAEFKSSRSISLANKLQKLLMMSSHKRLVLSKLVHLGSDLGLPPNFRSRLCNEYPERFKTVDTSYGRALELVSWDPALANPLPKITSSERELILDRPLKFKRLKLRKGLNLKRPHLDFLYKFEELPEICPYKTPIGEFKKASLEAEKRACSVVREVLGMTVEKRTLADHLTHFRKEFGLPNQLRGMLVRHPELFYVSLKGQRDSVFLVEAYNDAGELIETDDALRIKDGLFSLVREGKRDRRERRKAADNCGSTSTSTSSNYTDLVHTFDDFDEEGDGLDHLFDEDDLEFETHGDNDEVEDDDSLLTGERNFWTADTKSTYDAKYGGSGGGGSKPW